MADRLHDTRRTLDSLERERRARLGLPLDGRVRLISSAERCDTLTAAAVYDEEGELVRLVVAASERAALRLLGRV